jgi:rRNA-processing protein FCF1
LPQEPNKSFIVDANALIDYCDSDLRVLSQFSQHIGTVHIARSTFEKVKQLTESAAKKHSLIIKTPDYDTVMEASANRGSLAYDDRETLLLARRYGWICITNDVALRNECGAEGITCLWGLEPMKALVERKILSGTKVIAVAKKIQAANQYITEAIVSLFEQQIKEIESRTKKK